MPEVDWTASLSTLVEAGALTSPMIEHLMREQAEKKEARDMKEAIERKVMERFDARNAKSKLPLNCEECGETLNPFFERNELDLWNRYLEKTDEYEPSVRYWCECGYSYMLSLSDTIELLERWMKK